MPFDYFQRLSRSRQRIYLSSNEYETVAIPEAASLRTTVVGIQDALEQDNRRVLQLSCQELCDGLTTRLDVPAVELRVLAARPSDSWGELQGLYEPEEDGDLARITVWMRTAQRRQVVAFRTFLRTVLHELCHHLDYEYFELAETFHTEGFFKRESSLFRQLVAQKGGLAEHQTDEGFQ